MAHKRLKAVDWSIKAVGEDFKPALTRFELYLRGNGLRRSTVDDYVARVSRFLKYAQTDQPSVEIAKSYREGLVSRNLARSTINNYGFAIRQYFKMVGVEIDFPFLDRNDNLPFFFDQDDVSKILGSCRNIKHLAMLKALFFGCLRASELCNLDDRDIDLKSQTIRIREGKNGKEGIVFVGDECARTLKQYLAIRPPRLVEDRQPVFYTAYGQRFDRRDVHRMFVSYKSRAGITKPGGVHCFGRHSPASIMVAKGCDIRIVQTILRHNDIRTTLRYVHIRDETWRNAHVKFLSL